METEIKKLYDAYIRSDVPHDKVVAGLIREYGEEAVMEALSQQSKIDLLRSIFTNIVSLHAEQVYMRGKLK